MKTLAMALFLFSASFSSAQTHDCWNCNDQNPRQQLCQFLPGDGAAQCGQWRYNCPGGPCCYGQTSGQCLFCVEAGECSGEGLCTGSLQCPGTECCVNGYCYPHGSTQCENGLIQTQQTQTIQRPSVEVWAAYPWLTQGTGLFGEMEKHSIRPKFLDSVLIASRDVQLVNGIMPEIHRTFTYEGKAGYFFQMRTEADKQTLFISTYTKSPNVKSIDLLRGRVPMKLVETLVMEKDHWTLVNAKGKFTGKLMAFAPMSDPKSCQKAEK